MRLNFKFIFLMACLFGFLSGCISLMPVFGTKEPNLKIGVLSDVHIRCEPGFENVFVETLKWYDKEKVDVVAIAGDITDQTMNMELEKFARVWFSVFKDNRRSDGEPVVPFFVTGNHDDEGAYYIIGSCNGLAPNKIRGVANGKHSIDKVRLDITNAVNKAYHAVMYNVPAAKAAPVLKGLKAFERKVFDCGTNVAEIAKLAGESGMLQTNARALFFSEAFNTNLPAMWKRLFNEEYSSHFYKNVKGYDFVGSHWNIIGWGGEVEGLADYMKSLNLSTNKPIFYFQHPHPKLTCHGVKAWGQDNGSSVSVLTNYPNVIAFSGHSHHLINDERTIWQDGFVSIGTGSLYYPDMTPGIERQHYPNGSVRQGLLVEVYDDRVDVRRRDFYHHEELAPKWSIPIDYRPEAVKPYSIDYRTKNCKAPAFKGSAEITVTLSNTNAPGTGRTCATTLSFPNAVDGKRGGRLSHYIVGVEKEGTNGWQSCFSKNVFPSNGFFARSHWVDTKATIPARNIPAKTNIRFFVTPANAFGGKGKSIYSEVIKF